jgi:organic hydroperoxide reductase OsmC/OhrA
MTGSEMGKRRSAAGFAGDAEGEAMVAYYAMVKWRRADDERFVDARYSRAHDWLFDGGACVRASASPHSVRPPFSDPSAVDPEEALVAALSSCHMLFFLWIASRRGFAVRSYEDSAVGLMTGKNGRQWISMVRLRPLVVFDGDKRPTDLEVQEIHDESHDSCYIANSVKTDVLVEGRAEGTRT